MIEEIYNENSDDGEEIVGAVKKSETLSSFIKQLYPNKNVDDILIDTREFDPPKKTVVKNPEVKSRKERRFIERKQKKSEKSNKSGKVREVEKEKERSALNTIKADTRAEIGKRLAPIIFGINNYK